MTSPGKRFYSTWDPIFIEVSLMKWKIALEKDEDGWYTATVPSLPGCISQGKTRNEALKNIREAIELHLESLAEEGVPIRGQTEITTVAVRI